MDDKENPSAPQSQATNNNILEDLGRSWKGSLGVCWEKKSQVYKSSGCHLAWRRIQATLTNTFCPTSWRVAGLLYGLWIVRREGGRHVKVPGRRKSKRRDGIPGTPSPADGIPTDKGAQIWESPSSQWRGHFLLATVVPQYHLSERSISGWDKAVAKAGWSLNTAGGELPQVSYLIKLEKDINPWKAMITVWMTPVTETDSNVCLLSVLGYQCVSSVDKRRSCVGCLWKMLLRLLSRCTAYKCSGNKLSFI